MPMDAGKAGRGARVPVHLANTGMLLGACPQPIPAQT